MKIENFVSRIEELVRKDKLKEAIKDLNHFFKGSQLLDDVIVQSAKLSDLQRKIRNDNISFDDANFSRNKIRIAILSLAEEVKDQVLANDKLKKEIDTLPEEKANKVTINQHHSGSGDNIGGDKVINK